MALEQHLDAAVLTMLVHGLEETGAVAVALAHIHLFVAGEDVVLGAGAVTERVLETVLVGVVGVLHGLVGPCLADFHGGLAVERLESELGGCVGVVGGGPLAHVD